MGRRVYVVFVLALLVVGTGLAQTNPEGKIVGKVTDEQGSPLPGVTVQATSPKLVGKSVAVTDQDGVFRLMALPSGIYEISFALQGFKSLVRREIVLQLNQTIVVNVSLLQAAIEEQVTVTGQSPLIDVKSTVKGQTMTKEVFLNLPRSRDFDGLISTVPGVQNEWIAGGLSVDGATATENTWFMDGTDITDMHIGTRAQGAVLELVEEVNVTASGYSAEFGGSMGGVVNVITRSGGNSYHGDIIGFFENNSRLMQGKARDYIRWNPFDDTQWEYVNNDDLYYNGGKTRDPYARAEGVFNLGGYIIKDRLWFFGSFNPQFSDQKAPRFFLDNPELGTQNFHTKWNNWNGQFKLTMAPAKGLRVAASLVNNFSRYRGSIPSIDGTSGADYEFGKEGYDYPNLSGALMVDYTVNNNLLVSARLGYAMQNTDNQQINIPGTQYWFDLSNYIYEDDAFFQAHPDLLHYSWWSNWSGSAMTLNRRKYQKSSGNLDSTYYLRLGGEHAWKAGIQLIRDQENVSDIANHPIVDLFWGEGYYGLATGEPVMGTYGHYEIISSWTSPFGSLWNVHRNNWALYLQDTWTIGGRVTVNAGLRTESEYIPAFTKELQEPGYQDKPIKFGFGDKLAPRLGLVYDVFGDSSLKLFGSFGIYYDVMKLYMAEGAFGGFKWKTDYYELNDPDWTKIAADGDPNSRTSQEADNRYVGTMDWRIPSWDTTDPSLKPVAQREISLGAEKKIAEDLSLSLRLVQKHLIRTIEDTGVLTPEGEMYYNTNPGYGWSLHIEHGGKFLDQYWETPKAKREYYGLNLSLEKRFSHNWQGGVNYTLSRVAGNYGGLSSTDERGRNSPNVERYYDLWFMAFDLQGNVLHGALPQDRTHYIKMYGSYSFPFGLTVGVTAYGRSGYPLTTTLNANNTYIFPNNRGDLGRLPFTAWGDIYLEYMLKIGSKYRASVDLQINNFTNTKTWQDEVTDVNRISMDISDDEILSKTFNWQAALPDYWPNEMYKKYNSRFGTWSARLGVKLSF